MNYHTANQIYPQTKKDTYRNLLALIIQNIDKTQFFGLKITPLLLLIEFNVYQVGMLKNNILFLDFVLRHNISSTLPLKCIPTQKIRKFCCA